MSKLLPFVSATIVVIFLILAALPQAKASPQTEMPEPTQSDEQATDSDSLPIDENMTISKTPALPRIIPKPEARYYPYQQALTFRAGAASDFPRINMNESVLGFAYLFPKFLSPKLEAGADLHGNGRGHVHLGLRWIYFERSYFRPSIKAGIDHFMDAKNGLATLARKEDWYARGGGTLEYVVWNPYSLRLEGEMLANFDKLYVVFTMGVSRGW